MTFLFIQFNALNFGLLKNIFLAIVPGTIAAFMAAEIGTLKRAKSYNILNMSSVEQGTSGGISIRGTLRALAGALAAAISPGGVDKYRINSVLLYCCFIRRHGMLN